MYRVLDATSSCYSTTKSSSSFCDSSTQPGKSFVSILNRSRLKEVIQHLQVDHQHLDDNDYASLLRKCIEFKALTEGRDLHTLISKGEYGQSSYLCNLLTQLYGKCGHLHAARGIFDSLGERRNVYSWNIMITAYAQNGRLEEAKEIFDRSPQRTMVTYNAMVTAYSQNGHLQRAKALFDGMEQRDIVSWNAMLAAYAQSGHDTQTVDLFKSMDIDGVTPNHVSLISALDACGRVGELRLADALYDAALTLGCTGDYKVCTALVNAYGRCGSPGDAKRIFDSLEMASKSDEIAAWNALLCAYLVGENLSDAKSLFDFMPARDHISWNIMMVAFGRSGFHRQALDCFRLMDLNGIAPDSATFANLLDSCPTLEDGKTVHACAEESGYAAHLMVATSVVDMYGKCGDVAAARRAFDAMLERDVVAWNAMVAAYSHNGHGHEALEIFRTMDLEGVNPSESTFVSAVDACTAVADRAVGRLLHGVIVDSGYKLHGKVLNALVTMYGKCGDLVRARAMFDGLSTVDPILWNAMIGACAQFGHMPDALELLREMLQCGASPTTVTFTSSLVGCSRSGFFEESRELFLAMQDCGLDPNGEHFHCMVDLLCRAGKLREARDLIVSMPFEADFPAWSALVSACSVHGDSKLGREVANEVISLVPEDSGLYVCLSKVFSSAGMQDEVARLEQKRKDLLLKSNQIERENVFLANLLGQMYGKCCGTSDAKRAFDTIDAKNVFSWSSMVMHMGIWKRKAMFDSMSPRNAIAMLAGYARLVRRSKAFVKDGVSLYVYNPMKSQLVSR
ncbi:pentatricopeptide repeat-containing protein At2g13600-like [Selaginella moellendorffii]|uniref:pentatricopeptide repeat-containing protein At2g13600-like n=1 Tax=Selaginella moellendorffii TaxID=88036 RepID=UPI000D1C5961|nr:pentatricopeptide repeat-containing protein At2g13600-like [Selaginella moellendorffii]|eukprot:XP_024516890.1 pentatricopeptide repeat-containing protein At2g13600-like [Selaginella moellendorffii]